MTQKEKIEAGMHVIENPRKAQPAPAQIAPAQPAEPDTLATYHKLSPRAKMGFHHIQRIQRQMMGNQEKENNGNAGTKQQ